MPESHVNAEPSLLQERRKYRRGSRTIRRAATTKRLLRPKPRKKPVPPKKAWLRQPVRVRKITPAVLAHPAKPALPSRVSLRALKLKPVFKPVAGEWKGIVLTPVISSNVASYGYNKDENMLVIQFNDASIYEYTEVPEDVWLRFQTAPSKGKFVHREIRDVFPYERVA